MSTPGNLKLAFVVEAIDRATATVGRINKVIDKVTEPLRRVRAATTALMRESKLDVLRSAWGELGDRGQRLMSWGRGVTTMLFGMGAAAGVASFAFKNHVDGIDRALDQSKKLGISVATYQRLGFAFQMNGSSADEAGQGLKFLSQNMVEAINGSKEAAGWFERAGIPLAQLKRLDVSQVILRIADTFLKVGDSGQNASKKIALARSLMGRGGDELVQTLNLGSAGIRKFMAEADALGGVVGDEMAERMADFNDEFDRLRFAASGAMTAISRAVLPVFDDLVKRTTAWTVANRELIATRVADFVEKVLPRLPAFAASVVQITGAMAGMLMAADNIAQALGGWETVMAVVAGVIIGKGLVALLGLTTAVWGLGVALWATPIGWLIAGISALALGAGLVIKHWEPIKAFFEGIWNAMKRVLGFGAAGGGVASTPGISGFAATGIKPAPPAPSSVGTFGRNDLGGTLRIYVDAEGKPRVDAVRKNPGSLLDFDLNVDGGMAMVGR